MLQAADDNTWRDTNGFGKSGNSLLREVGLADEIGKIPRRNQVIAGENICFMLFAFIDATEPFEKQIFLAMQENMSGFVEEGKPEMVVALVAQAELD